ncbi:MAG: 4Fe-4S dicluster domain-containing protein [Thermoleophilia bacterium]|nr:4Fe-4S dicluster domain-containing protein [Thermoleophilia bacterium]
MIPVSSSLADGASLVAEIERRTGMRVSACYQCGRCTSTCPGAFAFDIPPHRMMRLLQMGIVERVLSSTTAQLCFDCMTCSLRCPQGVDLATIIETAKSVADEMGFRDTEKAMRVFRREFLKNVRRHGRLHEPSLLTWINLKTGRPFNDLSLVPLILRKKKVHFVPPRIRNLRHLRHIFRQVNGSLRSTGLIAQTSPGETETPAAGERGRAS